jgi:hypothetical protein
VNTFLFEKLFVIPILHHVALLVPLTNKLTSAIGERKREREVISITTVMVKANQEREKYKT